MLDYTLKVRFSLKADFMVALMKVWDSGVIQLFGSAPLCDPLNRAL